MMVSDAVMPSNTGILMSISTTSGRWRRQSSMASKPSAASPTTAKPNSPSSWLRSSRVMGSSSTTIAVRFWLMARLLYFGQIKLALTSLKSSGKLVMTPSMPLRSISSISSRRFTVQALMRMPCSFSSFTTSSVMS